MTENEIQEMLSLHGLFSLRAIGRRFGISGERVRQIMRERGLPSNVPPRRSTHGRFWEKVTLGDGCWEWAGSHLPSGYGRFRWARAGNYAHRASWLLTHGELSADIHVLHRCDNPSCVRPDHLFLGTPADNVHDSQLKGRRPTAAGAP